MLKMMRPEHAAISADATGAEKAQQDLMEACCMSLYKQHYECKRPWHHLLSIPWWQHAPGLEGDLQWPC